MGANVIQIDGFQVDGNGRKGEEITWRETKVAQGKHFTARPRSRHRKTLSHHKTSRALQGGTVNVRSDFIPHVAPKMIHPAHRPLLRPGPIILPSEHTQPIAPKLVSFLLCDLLAACASVHASANA